jgi:uncharacterized RDD family membrane protein YckC
MFEQYQSPNYAGFGRRFVAYLIDSILMAVIFLPVGFAFGAFIGLSGLEGDELVSVAASGLINLFSLIVTWLYSAILESSVWQATLRKRVLGIRVTDLSGNRISFGKATGRHFAKYLSSLVCLIGFIMAAFTEKKQALHDMLANTLVVDGAGTPSGITLDHSPPQPPDFTRGG